MNSQIINSSIPFATPTSPWQLMKSGKISCQEALTQLVFSDGTVAVNLLDPEVSDRFFQKIGNQTGLPPVVPLLLWQGCFFLGSPIEISVQDAKNMSTRLGMMIEIIAISKKSYRDWFRRQNILISSNTHLSINEANLPFDAELEPMAISETAELKLAKATDQIGRIKAILASALQCRASDIHLEPTDQGLRIRFRIDGILRDIKTLPLDISRKVIVALKVMADMDIAESRKPQDGRIGEQYTSEDNIAKDLDMRVSTLPCVNGEKIVIRLLPQENPFTTISDLGFTERSRQTYEKWLHQPQGMIIFTGPTGSGKTSTLYTSLQAIATENVNVTTVEDPVEYVLSNITQTQVNELAGMTFASGLRAILRQDPDIIMVGEIRDAETAETAIRAALTGHLVLTTMHTNDAPSAIPRIKDMGIDPSLVSDSLLGVVAQRLVRRVCPHCSEPHIPPDAEIEAIGLKRSEINSSNFRKGKGCPKCFNTGYLGREAIIELLEVDDSIRQIIYEGSMTELTRYLRDIDFQSFRQAAISKVMSGVTTITEVLRVLPRAALKKRDFPKELSSKVTMLNAS
jgi:type II secretory ATPase GspE/PulE/Tfp pilus assembly ATPase PilB-like protein